MNFATSNKNLVCNMQIRGLEWDFGEHKFVKETTAKSKFGFEMKSISQIIKLLKMRKFGERANEANRFFSILGVRG